MFQMMNARSEGTSETTRRLLSEEQPMIITEKGTEPKNRRREDHRHSMGYNKRMRLIDIHSEPPDFGRQDQRREF